LVTGIAVDRGYLRLDDCVFEYLGEFFDNTTEKAHRKITIRDWWINEDAYFARGFGGNEIAVFPKYRLVVVIQATAKKISKEYLDVIYNVILKEESLIS